VEAKRGRVKFLEEQAIAATEEQSKLQLALHNAQMEQSASADAIVSASQEVATLRHLLQEERCAAAHRTEFFAREVEAACDEAYAVARAAEGHAELEATAAESQSAKLRQATTENTERCYSQLRKSEAELAQVQVTATAM